MEKMLFILAEPSQNENGRRHGQGVRRASPHGFPGHHAEGMPAAGGGSFSSCVVSRRSIRHSFLIALFIM